MESKAWCITSGTANVSLLSKLVMDEIKIGPKKRNPFLHDSPGQSSVSRKWKSNFRALHLLFLWSPAFSLARFSDLAEELVRELLRLHGREVGEHL